MEGRSWAKSVIMEGLKVRERKSEKKSEIRQQKLSQGVNGFIEGERERM